MLLISMNFILIFSIFAIIFENNIVSKLGISRQVWIQSVSLTASIFVFFLSIILWIFFDNSHGNYQYTFDITFGDFHNILNEFNILNSYVNNFILSFGIDGISLFFVILSTFIIPLCLLTSYKYNLFEIKMYCTYFIILDCFLILSFTAMDGITFFFFFESILIPMFFLIGNWGSRERRVRATFLFFLFTLIGSIFLLFSLLIIYFDFGTTNFILLTKAYIPFEKQLLLFPFCYVAFSIKIPTMPMHTWLPEAHVEAPTAGSVILAGILLKLGGYGFIRVLLPVFSEATFFYLPLVNTLALVSIIYASLTTIRQIDMKRIIAYSSVAHMNLVVIGIFSLNIQGIAGSIFLMIAHGIVSSGLFFLIGVLYDKYMTRLIFYYGGLVKVMPKFSTAFLILSMANIGLPSTCNFIGELCVFIGLIDRNFFVAIFAITGVILSTLYTLFLCNRLIFGNINISYICRYKDLFLRESFVIYPLLFLTIYLGIFPDMILDSILTSVSMIVEQIYFF